MSSTGREAQPERTSYHHGSLRDALVDGAREMLVERGPEGFSLSALARRLGVSTAAPYRHFPDREALLCTLAIDGYRIFGDALDEAVRASTGTQDRLHRLGVAYLQFAQDHPALFEIMFAARSGGVVEAGAPTFEPLVQAVVDAQAAGQLPADQDPRTLSRTLWAGLHGLAVLSARGGLSKLGLAADNATLVADLLALTLREP